MNGRNFFDTNILRYSVDLADPRKQAIAQQVSHQSILAGTAVVSYQVLQEFLNVGFKKFVPPMSSHQAGIYLSELLQDFIIVSWSESLLRAGLSIRGKYSRSWYDSLIIAAALSAGCTTLYSEDWSHGQVIEGMTIVNPFV